MSADKSEVDPFDYDADARDRIWRLLEIRNIAWRERLKQSADTAGAQLEWAKPSLLGGAISDGSFYAGPAVMFPPGTVMIVLAQGKKAFSVHIRPASSEHSFTECITQAVDYVKECMGDLAEKCTPNNLGCIIEDLIRKYGTRPSSDNKAPELSNEHNIRIIGMLFAAVPEDSRMEMTEKFEQIIARGICPVFIGLIGKGSAEASLSMVWPLPLALAPYADTVIREDR